MTGMRESLHFGRIGGIRIGANWSLVPVFFLIAWSLAVVLLPAAAPGFTSWGYWFFALLTAAAFYASLLAHELSHAFVARRHGVAVRGIVLWLFGGVAQLETESPDARSELQIAAAGPATSLGIAAIAALVVWFLDLVGASPLFVAAVSWLAGANALLAVFNLLPAFPLDGGRILRGFLWRRWSDRLRATAVAAKVGRIAGYGIIVVGALEFLAGGGALGGIWLALIGWFITVAARQQNEQVVGRAKAERPLGQLRVADAMTAEPVTFPEDVTVDAFVQRYVRTSRFSSFPIADGHGRILGLATLRRIGGLPRASWASTPISRVAATPAEMVWCTPSDPLGEVAALMNRSPERRALAMDGNRLVGILTPSDAEWALRHARLFGEPLADGHGGAPRGAARGGTWGPAPQG
jgi:Zn-dependent protease